VFGEPSPLAPSGPPSWHGSLLESGQDASGYQYRRNRYYDPKTGRFTQEDPIGLAGGLNLYGFAGGDPVNFSDPFGLCPNCHKRDLQTENDEARRKQSGASIHCDVECRDVGMESGNAGLLDPLPWIAGGMAGGLRAFTGKAAASAVDEVATAELTSTHAVTRSSVRKLAGQIDRDGGIREPLKYVLHQGERYVVDGNHRLAAARLLGMRAVPAQRVDLPYKGFKTAADLIFDWHH
jgi:RHS repeat-associated protein